MSMRYVKFGSSGIKVSPIAFGLGFRQQRSLKEAQRIIEYAIDLGVNLFDCANNYSLTATRKSEEVLGTVLEKRRDDILITSKVNTPTGNGPNDRGTSRFHILREIDNSLRRLRTDHLDIYLLHAYDPDTTLDETLRAMDDLVTTGKVRYIGCCNFAAWQVCKALWTADNLKADPLICVQNPYNLLDRRLENEMFGLIRDQGLGSMAYSPLANGRLTNLGDIDVLDDSKTHSVVTKLSQIASKIDKTMAQIALNWVLCHNDITVAIAGFDTIQQVDDNLSALDWSLDKVDYDLLDKVSS